MSDKSPPRVAQPPNDSTSGEPDQTEDGPFRDLLTQNQRELIAQRLVERRVVLPCPRCGNDGFALEDAIFRHSVYAPDGTRDGTVNIPTVVTTCKRCGFLCEHALGALGLKAPGGRLLQ